MADNNWTYDMSSPTNLNGALGLMVNPTTGQKMPISVYQDMMKQQAQQEKDAQMKAQGLNSDGSPIRPDYQTLLDPNTGLMKSQYQINPQTLDPTKMDGYSAYKDRALSTGDSPWAQLMLQKQGLDENTAREGAINQTSQATAQARSGLAMRGGLSSGARERIATQGMRSMMGATQDVARQGTGARYQIRADDDKTRTGMLQNLANSEVDVGKYNSTLQNKGQEFNINSALEEKRAKDAQDLAVYQEQMKKWAAGKQADATAASGGGGK